MLIDFWNYLVWFVTADYMWIPAGISFFLIVPFVRSVNEVKGYPAGLFVPLMGYIWFAVTAVCFLRYDPAPLGHFLLWHLVIGGAIATAIGSGWCVVQLANLSIWVDPRRS